MLIFLDARLSLWQQYVQVCVCVQSIGCVTNACDKQTNKQVQGSHWFNMFCKSMTDSP